MNQTTISKYLITRLKQIGVDDIFGVPGDFGLSFFDVLIESEINYFGTCNELNAAYAADGYARIKGIGALAVTYTVGELSALNGVAGSFSERVPVIIIVGSPSLADFHNEPLLHHTLGNYEIPIKMFQNITVASTILNDELRAPEEIDRVLRECLRKQGPVYINLPTDMVNKPCDPPKEKLEVPEFKSNQDSLEEALQEAVKMLNNAKKPIIIADVELVRYQLQKEFSEFLDKCGFPFATLMMGKTVIDEDHPQFIGLYQGDRSRQNVKERVENADCVLELGVFLSDFNTGGFTMKLNQKKIIRATIHTVYISNHSYRNIHLRDFLKGLCNKVDKRDSSTLDIHPAIQGCVHRRTVDFTHQNNKKLCVQRIFDRIAHFIPENSIVIADTGQSMFSTAETLLPKGSTFIGQIFYGSIGYSVGATLGCAAAARDRPVILFVGDGSFQVTCQDISTMIRYGLKPLIFLLNNEGYLIERCITDGKYNDLQPWKYHALPLVFGAKEKGFDVYTEDQLEHALLEVEKQMKTGLTFVELHTNKMDASTPMKEAGKAMAKKKLHHSPSVSLIKKKNK